MREVPIALVGQPTITQALCRLCGACCSALVDGVLVACQHLDTSNGFRCRIYATRPQVCRDYTCIRDGRIASAAVAERVQAAINAAMRQELIHA